MSIVLVVLPGAPPISEEAQRKDKELNTFLETRVQGSLSSHFTSKSNTSFRSLHTEILSATPDLTVHGVVQALAFEDIANLPPGAGIEGK